MALQLRQIVESTCAAAHAAGLSDGEWTFNIFSELTRLGRGYGFKVRGARPGHDDFDAGWLWDLTWVDIRGWSRKDRADGELVRFPLVLESEWNLNFQDEILWDFQKLLVARADLRMMIFEQNTQQDADQCIKRMKDAIKSFTRTQRGDRYLFACWIIVGSQMLVEDYVHN